VLSKGVFDDANELLRTGERNLAGLKPPPSKGAQKAGTTQLVGPSFVSALNTSGMEWIAPSGEVDPRMCVLLLLPLPVCRRVLVLLWRNCV
jgi:hypothetical protein